MRKLTATLCLTLAVLLGSVGVSASADYEKGLTAAQSGDFATALREDSTGQIRQYIFKTTYRSKIGF